MPVVRLSQRPDRRRQPEEPAERRCSRASRAAQFDTVEAPLELLHPAAVPTSRPLRSGIRSDSENCPLQNGALVMSGAPGPLETRWLRKKTAVRDWFAWLPLRKVPNSQQVRNFLRIPDIRGVAGAWVLYKPVCPLRALLVQDRELSAVASAGKQNPALFWESAWEKKE